MAPKPKSKKPPKGSKGGKTLAQRLAASPALVKKYQSNPGLRSKYLTGELEKFLTPGQRKTRALNTRLATPIAPGSSTMERDLAHEAQAAVGVRYGPQDRALGQQLGQAQQVERDTGSLYDQYRQALQQHAASVQAFQAGAQQALAQTAAGITGLGGAEAAAMQQAAVGQAGGSGIPAGDLTGLANQALATRQGVMGSFQGQQALTGAANNVYAAGQANVVAPGQKLGALAQARGRTRDVQKNITDLATEKGAYDQQFRQERRSDEFKNQLAMQTLGVQAGKAATDAAATTARIQQSSPEGKSATAAASSEAQNASKYGYTVHQWRMLGPDGRRRVINSSKSKPEDSIYSSGPFAGKSKSQIAAMSQSARQQLIDQYNKGKGKGKGKDPVAPEWQPPARQSAARSQVSSLKRYAAMAKSGQPFVAGHSKQKPASRHEAALKIQQAVAAPDDPILLSAALDAVYIGSLSRNTVRQLIAAGYKPAQIASALGVGTLNQRASSAGRRTTRPGSGPAGARQ